MLASRLHGLEDIRLDTVDEPTPGDGEVRVKVAHNGICGSDLHMYFRESPWRSGNPITLGHEFCGVVDGLGSGVSGVELGTRVAVRPFYKCGECSRCKTGLEHLCTPLRVLGCGAHPLGEAAPVDVERPGPGEVGAVDVDVDDPMRTNRVLPHAAIIARTATT